METNLIELIILMGVGIIVTILDAYSTIITFKYSKILKNKDIEAKYKNERAEPKEMNPLTSFLHKKFGLVKGQIIKCSLNGLILMVLVYGFHSVGEIGYLIFGVYIGIILRQFTSVYFNKKIVDSILKDS